MKVVFLGTSAGVPTENRNHTSILLYFNGNYLLFDCGEGTQRQFKKAKISPLRLDKIFITHLHADHILGLAGLLQTLAMNDYNKELEIYGPKGIKNYIKYLVKFFPIINNIKIKIFELTKNKEKFDFKDFLIIAKKLKHTTETYGYLFEEKDVIKIKTKYVKLLGGPSPLFRKLKEGKSIMYKGKEIKSKDATYIKKGKRISIILDTKICKNLYSLAKNADLLIIECTYKSDLQNLAKNYFHLTTLDVIDVIKKSQPKKTIITHISERYSEKEQELIKEIKRKVKNVELAYDFMEINL